MLDRHSAQFNHTCQGSTPTHTARLSTIQPHTHTQQDSAQFDQPPLPTEGSDAAQIQPHKRKYFDRVTQISCNDLYDVRLNM